MNLTNKNKILFIVPYPKDRAPSQRLKFEQYIHFFEQAGYTCEFSPFMTDNFYDFVFKKGNVLKKTCHTINGYLKRSIGLFNIRSYDLIYLHLEAAPFGPPVFEWLYSLFGIPIIFDIDDMVMIKQSQVKGTKKTNWFVDFLRSRGKYRQIARNSKYIITVTKYINRYFTDLNVPVCVIPPTIDTDTYHVSSGKFSKSPSEIVIGWSGSYSTSQYLKIIVKPLQVIQEKYRCRIKVIGDENFRVNGLEIEAKAWELKNEVCDLDQIDIGVYPLTQDDWVLGKGGLKALQYMGMGIPTIATPVGVNTDIIRHGVNGYLADSDQEWIDALTVLIEDAAKRKEIGLAGRDTVEKTYSLKANAGKYLTVFEKVLSERFNSQF